MAVDKSRERSLYFLILTNLRRYVSQSSDIPSARQLASNLKLIEQEEFWEILTVFNGQEIKVSRLKSDFKFYATKDRSSYEVEPSQQNSLSAKSIIAEIFSLAGIENPSLPSSIVKTKSISSTLRRTNAMQWPLLFLLSLLALLKFLPEKEFSSLRVLVGTYLLLNFIGFEKFKKNVYTYIPMTLLASLISYFASIHIETSAKLLFTSLLLVTEASFTYLPKLNSKWILALYGVTISWVMINMAFHKSSPFNWVVLTMVGSAILLNMSKILHYGTNGRKVLLLSGFLCFVGSTLMLFQLSISGFCRVLFVLGVALIMQLTSRSDSSTKIFLGFGWVMSP